MPTTPDWAGIASTRFIKDDANTYDEHVIQTAKDVNANFILLSFTGTSGKRERWQWKLIPEFVRKCHEDGLKVSFYMKLTNINWKPMFHERPESRDWLMRYSDGTPALYSGFPNRYLGCLNNPSWRQHLKDAIAEAVQYEPDALFYDNCFIPSALHGSRDEGAGSSWACYCDVCREAFRAYTEATLGWSCALPEEADWDDPVWQAFIDFRDKALVEAISLVTEYAHELKPDILVYPNVRPPWHGGGGSKGSATTELASHADLLLFERRGGPRLDMPPEQGERRAVTGMVDWKYGSRLGRGPIWYRMNQPAGVSYTPDEIRIGMAEASSHNGANHHVMTERLARDPEAAAAVKDNFDYLEKYWELYTDVQPVADVAVLVSNPTTDWYLPDHSEGGEAPKDLDGMAQALAELHIPFNVVIDEDLEDDLDYRVLVLPNVACMSNAQAEAIARFVERGGGLVATNLTSLHDEKYRIRSDYALAKVFGTHHGEEADGVVKNEYGKGLSAFIPGDVDDAFWKSGLPSTLALYQDALTHTLRDDWQVQVDAPTTVVVNITERIKSGTAVLHFTNFEAARRVEGVGVTLRKPEGRATASVRVISPDVPDLIELDFAEDSKAVSFTVPSLKIYDVIVVHWQV